MNAFTAGLALTICLLYFHVEAGLFILYFFVNFASVAIEKEMPLQKKLYDAEVANALTEKVREQ